MKAPYAVVVACDMPLLQRALLGELLRLAPLHDAVVPVNDAALPEPLCAAYARGALAAIRGQLEAGAYKVSDLFSRLKPHYLYPEAWRQFDATGLSFHNVNREAELRRAEAFLRGEAAPT
jgi:molybdopterin-guanine dinucleotide biosynthesis protein A